ncbi:MAG: hypothetical protein K8R58_02855 [Bacteroidales bacterium]|nr:hypothetical protein [Bacteroidales bacterium]
MKNIFSLIIQIFLLTNFIINNSFAQQNDLSYYLPDISEIGEWLPTDSAQRFKNDELFYFINGGADIFHEYGFNELITCKYSNNNNKTFRIEIYQMNNNNAAFGIYSMRKAKNGKIMEIGFECLLYDNYLIFWKDKFFLVLSWNDLENIKTEKIISIAKIIDSKIINNGNRPDIAKLFSTDNLKTEDLKYIKGNIALNNIYSFGYGNIFGFNEGIVGDYKDYKIFIFKYNNEGDAVKWYNNAKGKIENNKKFNTFKELQNSFSVTDNKYNDIYYEFYINNIIILLCKENIIPDEIINNIKENLTN